EKNVAGSGGHFCGSHHGLCVNANYGAYLGDADLKFFSGDKMLGQGIMRPRDWEVMAAWQVRSARWLTKFSRHLWLLWESMTTWGRSPILWTNEWCQHRNSFRECRM
ncbi:MAG TPA: hypothetical protein VGD24_09150, partial [Gallionella sp.]